MDINIPGSVGTALGVGVALWLGASAYIGQELNLQFASFTAFLIVCTIGFEIYTANKDRKNRKELEEEKTKQLEKILESDKNINIEWKK
jgi:hypothetical protein